MAVTFLNNLDLAKNELRNARVQNLATAPSSPVAGQLYYDTDDNVLYWWNGSAWVAAETGAPTGSAGGDLTGTYPNPSIAAGVIVNADVNASAAIAYSKLNLGSSIVNADVAAGAAVAYSKLALTGAILNADLAGSIAYSKLSLTGAILNADLAGSIALSKLATDPLARANHTGTQTASTVSDFDTQVRTSRLDQMTAPTGSVSLNSQKITNLLDPASAQDAATKAYVDATASGLDVKKSVRAATAAAGTLATSFENGDAIDGVTLATGDRILVKNQASGAENGIYVVAASGAPARATDADASAEVTAGMFVFVEEGTAGADSGWVLTNDGAVVLGTTALTFAQFSGAGQITAGAGMTKTGNTLDVVGTTNRISVAADAVDISTSYVGQATITTLGTITTGVWTGTDVAVADGGTGASTAAGAKTNLGFMTRYAADVGDNSATSFNIDHNLGTLDVIAEVYDKATGAKVIPDITHSTTNRVVLAFAVAPATDAYRVVVIG